MFLRIKRLTNRRNRCDSMFGEYIEKPSKNHLDTFHKRSTVTSIFRMCDCPFQIIYNRQKIFDQGLIGKANGFVLFPGSSLLKIL